MAKSAAMLVTFLLLGLFSFQAAAQGPAPAPVAGGPTPTTVASPPPPPVAASPTSIPVTPIAAPTTTPTLAPVATLTPSLTPSLTPVATPIEAISPTAEAPAPIEPGSGVGARQTWSGVAVASVIVAAMVL